MEAILHSPGGSRAMQALRFPFSSHTTNTLTHIFVIVAAIASVVAIGIAVWAATRSLPVPVVSINDIAAGQTLVMQGALDVDQTITTNALLVGDDMNPGVVTVTGNVGISGTVTADAMVVDTTLQANSIIMTEEMAVPAFVVSGGVVVGGGNSYTSSTSSQLQVVSGMTGPSTNPLVVNGPVAFMTSALSPAVTCMAVSPAGVVTVARQLVATGGITGGTTATGTPIPLQVNGAATFMTTATPATASMTVSAAGPVSIAQLAAGSITGASSPLVVSGAVNFMTTGTPAVSGLAISSAGVVTVPQFTAANVIVTSNLSGSPTLALSAPVNVMTTSGTPTQCVSVTASGVVSIAQPLVAAQGITGTASTYVRAPQGIVGGVSSAASLVLPLGVAGGGASAGALTVVGGISGGTYSANGTFTGAPLSVSSGISGGTLGTPGPLNVTSGISGGSYAVGGAFTGAPLAVSSGISGGTVGTPGPLNVTSGISGGSYSAAGVFTSAALAVTSGISGGTVNTPGVLTVTNGLTVAAGTLSAPSATISTLSCPSMFWATPLSYTFVVYTSSNGAAREADGYTPTATVYSSTVTALLTRIAVGSGTLLGQWTLCIPTIDLFSIPSTTTNISEIIGTTTYPTTGSPPTLVYPGAIRSAGFYFSSGEASTFPCEHMMGISLPRPSLTVTILTSSGIIGGALFVTPLGTGMSMTACSFSWVG